MDLSSLPNLSNAGRLAGALVFLGFGAFFSAVLTALSSFVPLEDCPEQPQRRQRAVRLLLAQPLNTLASAQLGRTIAVLGFAWLTAPPVYRLLLGAFGQGTVAALVSAVLTLILLAVLVVTLVQQPVRAVAGSDPARTIHTLAQPLRIWQALSYPFTAIVVWLSRPLRRAIGEGGTTAASRPEILRRLLDENLKASELDEAEQMLLSNVFEFSTTIAHEMMVPRPDVVWISTEATLEQVRARLNDSGHTRFPLCDGSPDKVVGYLHAKDLAFLQSAHLPEHLDLRKLARPVAFVPESARAMTLLKRFQEERSHLAVVVDEFGGMAGVLTLEDLLEELVGEIQDEFDVEEPDVLTLETGELLVDGSVRLEELEDALDIDFGEVEEETVGGFIFGRLAREVNLGEELEVPGAVLRVEDVEGLRVTRVRVSLVQAEPSSPDTENPPPEVATETHFAPQELGPD
ncbi:MAG TPA: hemolysin family protein [Trueperaceae bacterium]